MMLAKWDFEDNSSLIDFTLFSTSLLIENWIICKPGDRLLINSSIANSYKNNSSKRWVIKEKGFVHLTISSGSEVKLLTIQQILKHCRIEFINDLIVKEKTKRESGISTKEPDWLCDHRLEVIPNKRDLRLARKVIRHLQEVGDCSFESVEGAVFILIPSGLHNDSEKVKLIKLVWDHLTDRFPIPMHRSTYTLSEWSHLKWWCVEGFESREMVSYAYKAARDLEGGIPVLYEQVFVERLVPCSVDATVLSAFYIDVKKSLSGYAGHFIDIAANESTRSIDELRGIQSKLRGTYKRLTCEMKSIGSILVDGGDKWTPQGLINTFRDTSLIYKCPPILNKVFGITLERKRSKYNRNTASDVIHRRISIETYVQNMQLANERELEEVGHSIQTLVTDIDKLDYLISEVTTSHIPTINRRLREAYKNDFHLSVSKVTNYQHRERNLVVLIRIPGRQLITPKFSEPGLAVLVAKNYIAALSDQCTHLVESKQRHVSYVDFEDAEYSASLRIKSMMEEMLQQY